jgi:hypothetical protein
LRDCERSAWLLKRAKNITAKNTQSLAFAA